MEGRISKADGCLLSALTAGNSEGASKEAFAEAALFGTNRHCLKSPVRLSVTGRGKPHAGMCVQRRLACSAGDSPVGVKARSPVARIAGWRETEILKPIDKVI